jgi:uncharacterized membrane-anchored protein
MPADTQMIRKMLNKVPEITLYFWIIKVLCTTVGETASYFLNLSLNFGLRGTSIVMGIVLAIALATQFSVKRYVPVLYWLNVVLISIFGTLVTDNLTDGIGFPLEYSTIIFSVLLLITFAVWYWYEKTLSIHSIFTSRREAFYWLAVLFTFALGTATGDLYAEALGLGYFTTGVIVVILVTVFAVAWRMGLNSILAFWLIYIMTRPLGASIGDLLTQTKEHGGLGLGATTTTAIFTLAIALTVLYLAIVKPDVTSEKDVKEEVAEERRDHILIQVVIVTLLLAATAIGGYLWRSRQLQVQQAALKATVSSTTNGGAPVSALGDLSTFKTVTQAILDSVQAGDWSGANNHTNDLEYAWDHAEPQLKPLNPIAWTHVDSALDKVFREVRAVSPNQQSAAAALQALQAVLNNP